MGFDVEQLLEVIRKRRSVREYRREPVPDEYVSEVLEAGRWAPSGANTQPWEFIVIKDQQTKKFFADTFKEGRPKAMKIFPSFPWDKVPPPEYLLDVPVIIAVVADQKKKEIYPGRKEETFYLSVGMAMQNICLAATSLGLGSVCLTHFNEKAFKEYLGIPEDYSLIALIPLGYPTKPIGSWYSSAWLSEDKPRKQLERMVHYEKFSRT